MRIKKAVPAKRLEKKQKKRDLKLADKETERSDKFSKTTGGERDDKATAIEKAQAFAERMLTKRNAEQRLEHKEKR